MTGSDGGKLLSEMNTVLNGVTASADTAELPFESIGDFSTDPVSFGEMSERMLEKVEFLFDLSAIYNRYSDEYLKICAVLEKGIKYLASSCITKAALDYAKKGTPVTGQLSLEKLYGMASFNYRKLDTALTEQIRRDGRNYSPDLLEMDFRYYHLLLRLRATEQKKSDYFIGVYYNGTGNPLEHMGRAFNDVVSSGPRSEPPVFRSAPAFPVRKEEIIDLQAKQEAEADESLKIFEKAEASGLKNSENTDQPETKPETLHGLEKPWKLPPGIGTMTLKEINEKYGRFVNGVYRFPDLEGDSS